MSPCWIFPDRLSQSGSSVAAMLRELGVGRGDRVLLYMSMVPQAVYTMLPCTRLGGGAFCCVRWLCLGKSGAGSRAGKVVPYKPLLDQALALSRHPASAVIALLVVNRGLAPFSPISGRNHDYEQLRARHQGVYVPVQWLESSEPSYILYTSGTTGKPKGMQRDTGGVCGSVSGFVGIRV